jgi:cyclohexadienyl dehydratase
LPEWASSARSGPFRRRILLTAAVLLLWIGGLPASGIDPKPLRVGSSGDYAPFSIESSDAGGELRGFDVALARAYAEDRDRPLELVRFRWPRLLADLEAGRFEVAMSGVTVRPDRSVAGRFSVPVVETGALVLARGTDRWRGLDDLDRSRVRIGVNAGGHLERVARIRFSRATLIAIPDNASVRRAFADGQVDAVVTDTAEAPAWEGDASDIVRLGPFTRDRKAFLVRADAGELAADLDGWILERERDGTLARMRREHLGASGQPLATPLSALLAAVDERLTLMPIVAVVKRSSGVPLEVPEREEIVLDRATTAALAAAHRADVRAPSSLDIRSFFRAQMEAAKQVQRKAVQDATYAPDLPLPDLDRDLRPALLRIGERIARLSILLPGNLEPANVRAAAKEALRAPYLPNASRRAIADAVVDLTRRVPSPAPLGG